MKTAIALITAALTATSAHAWGDREQGVLTGIFATIILQQMHRDSQERQPREPVIVHERRQPAPVIVYRQPQVVIIDTPQIMCPQGTAEFYTQRFDRNGRPFYVFDGCR